MVVQRFKNAYRYGKMVLGKLSSWVATDLGTVCSYLACSSGVITLALYLCLQASPTTGGSVLVDRPVTPDHPQTITKYYSASFEAEDTLQIDREVYNMSFNKDQFREKIRAVLRYLEPEIPYSEQAVELLMLTAAQESRLGTYLKQVKGPARGVFQIEPATEIDMWISLNLEKYKSIKNLISNLMGKDWPTGFTPMEMNLAYAIAMARFYYWRIPDPLPKLNTLSLASYWKKYYNTYLGAGKVEEAVRNYERYAV